MLVVYEAQTRSGLVSNGRRSLPVRFRKTTTKILGRPRIPRTIQPLTLGNQHLVCLSGSHPYFVYEDRLDGLVCSNWTEPITSLASLELDGEHELLMVTNEVSGSTSRRSLLDDFPRRYCCQWKPYQPPTRYVYKGSDLSGHIRTSTTIPDQVIT